MIQQSRSKHVPIGELLVNEGLLTQADLQAALEHKKKNGGKLGQALVELKLVSEEEVAAALRSQGKIHCVQLSTGIVDKEVATYLGEALSRKFTAIAINRIAAVTTVAMEDPADIYAVDEMSMKLQTSVLAVYSEPSKINAQLDQVFTVTSGEGAAKLEEILESAGEFDVSLEVIDDDEEDEVERDDEDLNQPVIQMIRRLLEEANTAKASDIHIETRHDRVVIRFRVDGSLYERLTLPKSWSRPCITRLKVLANLDIAQRRLPQDGRLQVEMDGARVDLRLATTPTMTGENAVIRILAGGTEVPSLEELGLDESQLDALDRMITAKDGCVLTTGPTGSGKTTTLYSILKRLNSPKTKIITLEDPVEIQQDGLSQISTNAKAGLTFATGLRSILRQDPDVVLVGEMRDQETAQIGIQAALTGHLVLSTLHTVGTAETVSRMVDMGIEPYLLADTLRGIIAQRLVRRICTYCKEPATPEAIHLQRLELKPEDVTGLQVGRGCERCMDSGFSGRLALYEIMPIGGRIAEMVAKGVGTEELRRASVEVGLTTLRADGLRKANQGLTSLQEVLAVTSRTA